MLLVLQREREIEGKHEVILMLAHGPKLGKRKVSTWVGGVNNGVGSMY